MAAQVDLLVRNCIVVTCNAEHAVHLSGALAVNRGRIEWVGSLDELPALSARRELDAHGAAVIPGLINTHCHLADSLFRGLVEDLPLEEWLQAIWRAERAILTPETTQLGATLGLAELALGGVTCVLDMFWHPEAAAQAAQQCRMRLLGGGFAFDPPGMDGRGPEQRLADAERFIAAWRDEPLVQPLVMAHGAYTAGPQALRAFHSLARAHGLLFHLHAAETAQENRTVHERYGARVIAHLADNGLLGPETLLAHAVHLDDADIGLLARSGTKVAHNPVSNLKLGSGIARIADLLRAKVAVGLGTDGAVSGNDLDMWLAMRLAAIVPRGAGCDSAAVTAGQALHMATLNAARAIGMDDRIGSLEAGKQADFIMLELSAPHALPMFDPITHLVFAAGRADVQAVWVAGRMIVADRRLLTVDTAQLRRDVVALQPRIAASIR